MCGIAGILGGQPAAARGRLSGMLSLLSHRGPDDEGVHSDGEACLGHRRLSIIDLSQGGHQPMLDGRSALLLNGEIYNHKELRRELEAKGASFRSTSDTEVLLRGLRTWGDGVVDRIKGMFAFAYWDPARRRLFCARDRFGEKPFYFYAGQDEFVFASEVQAVASALRSRPAPDPSGLAHYLLAGYFAPGRSVYSGISILPPGHCLELDRGTGRVKVWPYWEARLRRGRAGARMEERTPERLMGQAVGRCFESDVPVGLLLSGGVDSSLVSLVAAERFGPRIRTFTATFDGTPFDEAPFAAQVAAKTGGRQTEVAAPLEDLPAILPRLVVAYGEPMADYSAIPVFKLFEAIKPHVKVVLTGDGGDEVFAGYKDGLLFLLREATRSLRPFASALGVEALGGLCASRSRRLRELGFACKAVAGGGGDLFLALFREGWDSRWAGRLLRPEAMRRLGIGEMESDVRRRFLASGDDDLERYFRQAFERLSQCFLTKIDRASMAHSIEARAPLLDADLFTWASALPAGRLLRGWRPKSVLKEMLAARMGRRFARRTKMGFTPPLTMELKRPGTRRWAEGLLTGKESLAYSLVSPENVRLLFDLHQAGEDQTGRIWKLLFLEQWHARFHRWAAADAPGPINHEIAHH